MEIVVLLSLKQEYIAGGYGEFHSFEPMHGISLSDDDELAKIMTMFHFG